MVWALEDRLTTFCTDLSLLIRMRIDNVVGIGVSGKAKTLWEAESKC